MDSDRLKAAGFSDSEVSEYQKLKIAGFSDDEIQQHYSPNQKQTRAEIPASEGKPWVRRAAGFVAPALPVAGALAGGALAAPTGPVGAVGGAALGYAGGRQLENVANAYAQGQKPPTMAQQAQVVPSDVMAGALAEEGGIAAGKALPYVARAVGTVAKPVLGALSGVGKGAIEEAISSGKKLTGNIFKSQTAYDRALRGEISGEEVVDNAKAALTEIKNKRSAAYQEQMQKVKDWNHVGINLDSIKGKVNDLLKNYVRHDYSNGNPDWSRSALGSKAVGDVKDIVELVEKWGDKPLDNTVSGLDMLKRQLDDYYSESSNARSFVASVRNIVKDTAVKSFPAYEKMTKGYEEATRVIKDIESGLMMRKQGMTGRVVADQTLRRLVSAMRQNFPLRRDLVNMLGKEGGRDVAGQISGHSMSEVAPRGIAGSGPALTIESMGAMLHPQFLPLLASSSPRLQGEFLRLFGKGMVETGKIAPTALKAASYAAMQGRNPKLPDLSRSASASELPDASPASKSIRSAQAAYTKVPPDYVETLDALRQAIKDDPRRGAELRFQIQKVMNEMRQGQRYNKGKQPQRMASI